MGIFEWVVLINLLLVYWILWCIEKRIDGHFRWLDVLAKGQTETVKVFEAQALKNKAIIGYYEVLKAKVDGKPINPEDIKRHGRN